MHITRRVFVGLLFVLLLSFASQPSFALEKININTATVEQLVTLKGVGEKTAQSIIAYRTSKPFASVDELTNVKGIGPKTLEKFRDQLTLSD